MTSNAPDAQKIGIALSGGGFRAAAFHLGVLKRLEELGVLARIGVLSTVSGGSMTGALYALRCSMHGDGRPGSFLIDDLIAEMRPVLTGNLRGRALFGSPLRVVRTLASFVIPNVRRMPLIVGELDRLLFRGALIGELPPWIVINATNLRTGKNWKFYRDCAGDYLAGVTRKTGEIRVAEAVGASAAYPVLVDPYPFHTRWEDLQEPPPRRWERPPPTAPGSFSRWRTRFGRPRGKVTFPLVDGGVYDNEGINSLRSERVTHAVISSTAPPDADFEGGVSFRSLPRTIDVMHSRLGAVTRQFAHEITHGVHPTDARAELHVLRGKLGSMAAARHDVELAAVADRLGELAAVGWPPRGRQFVATAQILLHRTDISLNVPTTYNPPYDIPEEDRGLPSSLIEELSRIRTDLDRLEPETIDLLIAQAYYLTDAHVKIAMPNIVRVANSQKDVQDPAVRPLWSQARDVINRSRANEEHTRSVLAEEHTRSLLGRSEGNGEKARILCSLSVVAVTVCIGALAVARLFLRLF